MNFIAFTNTDSLNAALNILEMEATPAYSVVADELRIYSDECEHLDDILVENDFDDLTYSLDFNRDDEDYDDSMDGDFDSGMASAGHGTGEDYGEFDERF
jgi:hypothetical protein